MGGQAWGALVLGVVGLLAGLAGPRLISRIPEPAPVEDDPPAPKELYAEIAALPRLALWLALLVGVAGALVGHRIGWHGALVIWGCLIPLGAVLAVVDWRTRLLPTYLIAPSYFVLALLALLASALDHDLHALIEAALGWLVVGGFYLLMWLVYPRGIGYGDVRLSGLLGIALGYLGWPEVLVGGYAGLLVGSVGGFGLAALHVVDRRHVPFGPFMVLGAVLGVLFGPAVATSLGY